MQVEDKENPRNLSKDQLDLEKKADEDYVKQLEVAQYKIRGKPDLYTKEIQSYSEDFKSFFAVVKEQPLLKNKKFAELAVFLSRVAHFFKTDLGYLQDYIQEFMEHYAGQMNPFLRKKMISSYMIMRAQNLILPYKALTFLFKMFSVPDKDLRKMISAHIINDLKRMNKHHKNEKINKQIQNFIFEILKKNSDILAKRSLQLMIQMFKKCIWNDPKTINIISHGCFNDYYKVRLTSCHFLIETTENIQDIDTSDSDDENEDVNPREKLGAKKTKARVKRLEQEKKKAAKKQRKKLKKTIQNSFFPIDQIYNPQEFTEKLFSGLRKHNEKFGGKLVVLSLIARMVNRHKLQLTSFYSYLQKYLMPHQKEVTKILAFLAESTHELVHYDDLAPIVKQIVDNFINQRCSEQSMAMGLNTIREMCNKNVYLLDKFTVNYLADYWNYKNRSVSKSAKALINVYREKNPLLLEKKYRGRYNKDHKLIPQTQDEANMPTYTIERPVECIDGANLLDDGTGTTGNPIEWDRVLTDEDFRKIRFLQDKQRQKDLEKRYADSDDEEEEEESDDDSEEYDSDEEEDEDEEMGQGNEEEDGKKQQKQNNVDENDEEMSEISELDSGDDIDDEDDVEGELKKNENNIQEDDGEWEDEDEGDKKIKSTLSKDPEVLKIKSEENSMKLKKENQKRKAKELRKNLEGYSDYESDDDQNVPNPHGFISDEVIKNFRKKKSERRQDERDRREAMTKDDKAHKHTRKTKGGGTTNMEKMKNKPMMMVMDKKHKEKRQNEKKLNIKSKIKAIKSQLGHVRSQKQFDRKKTHLSKSKTGKK